MVDFSLDDRTPRIVYNVAAGAFQSVFTFPFEFFDVNEIIVITDDGTTVTTMENQTGFFVTGIASGDGLAFESGSIELDTRVDDIRVTIYRSLAIDRLQQHPPTGPFNIGSLNTALSRIFAIAQEQRLELSRTFHLAPEDPTSGLVLPDKDTRAGKYLFFDANGIPTVSDEVVDTGLVTISAAMVPVVGAATVASALSLMDGGDKGAANVWTALNTFQATVRIDSNGGTTAILRDTTPGHNSNTAELDFSMESNVPGTFRDYGKITVGSPTIADGNEDGDMLLRVREDGSLVTYLKLDGDAKLITAGQPIVFSAPGTTGQVLTSLGGGVAATFQDQQGVAQVVDMMVTATKTSTTVIPYDNTIPQSTEGEEVTTVAITPTNASSKLVIQWQVNIAQNTDEEHFIGALFKDSDTDALHAEAVYTGDLVGTGFSIKLVTGLYTMTAGTTSPITFKLRYGSTDAASCYANADQGGNSRLGASGPQSGIIITEVLP